VKPIYEFAGFRLDLTNKTLFHNATEVPLTPKAFDTLTLLVEHSGQLIQKDEFMRQLWPETFVEDAVLADNISRLRLALGDHNGLRLIATVPKRGYRFVGDVRILDPAEAAKPISPGTGRSRLRGWQGLMLVSIGMLLVAAVPYFYFRRPAQLLARARAVTIRSLAVLPLENLSYDPEQEYFADGMTEEVIARLSMIRGLRVISRTSVMRFKDTRTPVPEIAKTLGVDAMVEGSVIREGSRVRVHIQLIRGATDEHFWSETYDRELGDALALESEVAQAIAGRVEATVTGESQKFSTTQALLLYVEIVKARFLPSGEATGTPRIELVVHNSETSPFELT
jgi:TolB-like protein/DNA-binding winged helix-turn-helix (wHTH) protein